MARAAERTRSRRSTAATGSSGLIKASWEGISGGAGVERGGGGLLRRAAGRRWPRDDAPRSTAGRRRRAARAASSRCSASRPRRHAAAPTLEFDVHVRGAERPAGLHDRADGADHDRARAARLRRRDARARLVELFGAPERWATTTRSLLWHRRRRARAELHRLDDVRAARCRAATTSSSPPPSTSTRCPDGEVPLGLPLQRHDLLPRRRRARCRCRSSRGAARPSSGCRSRVWRDADRAPLPERRLDRAAATTRSRALQREKARRGAADARRRRRGAARGGADDDRSSALVDSLLYEGYALYPYTPGATKNATPTPFGIVYPPAYAAELDSTFDQLRIECVRRGAAAATLTRRCASCSRAGSGTRRARDAGLPPAAVDGAAAASTSSLRPRRPAAGAAADARRAARTAAASGHVLRREPHGRGAGGWTAADALRRSLLSTHPVLRIVGGPLPLAARGGPAATSVNT